MEQKPGWSYSYVESLDMQIAVNDSTGVMYTEDKIKYSPDEYRILLKKKLNYPLQAHILKKVFNGTIIEL